jgi:hypothetical protein
MPFISHRARFIDVSHRETQRTLSFFVMVVDTATWMRNALYLAQRTRRTLSFFVMVVDTGTWMRNALYLAQSEVYRCITQRTRRTLSFFVMVVDTGTWMRNALYLAQRDAEDAEFFWWSISVRGCDVAILASTNYSSH